MKKRSLGLLILLLIALLLWWRWPEFRRAPDSAQTPGSATSSASGSPAGSPATKTPAAAALPPAGLAATLERKVAILHDLAQTSNRPIQFYGLVVDQDDNPIPEVKVTLEIRTTKERMPGVVNDVFEHPVAMTDGRGRFAITDASGALLAVKSLEKNGYEPSSKAFNHSYWYWSDPREVFHPDVEKPEVFHLWKKAGAERLIRKGIGSGLPTDGTSTAFDLFDGRTTKSGGDLRVTLTRNPPQISWGQTHYEWTVTIEAIDGGMIESRDEQMYRAPTEGYQPKVVVQMPADDQQWTDQKNITLYLKLRGGKFYGRASLEFMIGSDRPITPFSIASFINPSGSRNLEYDPLQDVVKSSAHPKP